MKIFLVFIGYCGSVDTSQILSFHSLIFLSYIVFYQYFSILKCKIDTKKEKYKKKVRKK